MNASYAASDTLSEIKTGEHAVFVRMEAARGVTGRLTSLGFTPGVELEMTQNYGRGPLMVTVRGTRVALGREEARCIRVRRAQAAGC